MDGDDPDALEALCRIPATSSTMYIENLRLSYEKYDQFDLVHEIGRGMQHGELPKGHLMFLANLMLVANKYNQPEISEVLVSFVVAADVRTTAQVLPPSHPVAARASVRSIEGETSWKDSPADIFRAIGIVEKIRAQAESTTVSYADRFVATCLDLTRNTSFSDHAAT